MHHLLVLVAINNTHKDYHHVSPQPEPGSATGPLHHAELLRAGIETAILLRVHRRPPVPVRIGRGDRLLLLLELLGKFAHSGCCTVSNALPEVCGLSAVFLRGPDKPVSVERNSCLFIV